MKFNKRFLPNTLFSRLSLVLVIGILLVQFIGNFIWVYQIRADVIKTTIDSSKNIARPLVNTISYLERLPKNYQPIVLEQLREAGGSRFFVAINDQAINIQSVEDAVLKDIVFDEINRHLSQQFLPGSMEVSLAYPKNIVVNPNGTRLIDLGDHLVSQYVVVNPKPAPLLIVQKKIDEDLWVYVATLMPDPFFLDRYNPLTFDHILIQALTLFSVLVLSFFVVRWLTRPLKTLSTAADAFGKGHTHDPLPVNGYNEYSTTARAFNEMETRIQRYMDDRERLFASISHDLRTPITRLRLRSELLDDEQTAQEFDEDLEELELLVKGALQSVKDSDIHENHTDLDLNKLILKIVDQARIGGNIINYLSRSIKPIQAKPLALKRAITNIIDNAIFYGQTASITLVENEAELVIKVRDRGPGIDELAMKKLFDPYVRLNHGKNMNQQGMGLGLGIARNIIQGHGGELTLANHENGGLEVSISLPIH